MKFKMKVIVAILTMTTVAGFAVCTYYEDGSDNGECNVYDSAAHQRFDFVRDDNARFHGAGAERIEEIFRSFYQDKGPYPADNINLELAHRFDAQEAAHFTDIVNAQDLLVRKGSYNDHPGLEKAVFRYWLAEGKNNTLNQKINERGGLGGGFFDTASTTLGVDISEPNNVSRVVKLALYAYAIAHDGSFDTSVLPYVMASADQIAAGLPDGDYRFGADDTIAISGSGQEWLSVNDIWYFQASDDQINAGLPDGDYRFGADDTIAISESGEVWNQVGGSWTEATTGSGGGGTTTCTPGVLCAAAKNLLDNAPTSTQQQYKDTFNANYSDKGSWPGANTNAQLAHMFNAGEAQAFIDSAHARAQAFNDSAHARSLINDMSRYTGLQKAVIQHWLADGNGDTTDQLDKKIEDLGGVGGTPFKTAHSALEISDTNFAQMPRGQKLALYALTKAYARDFDTSDLPLVAASADQTAVGLPAGQYKFGADDTIAISESGEEWQFDGSWTKATTGSGGGDTAAEQIVSVDDKYKGAKKIVVDLQGSSGLDSDALKALAELDSTALDTKLSELGEFGVGALAGLTSAAPTDTEKMAAIMIATTQAKQAKAQMDANRKSLLDSFSGGKGLMDIGGLGGDSVYVKAASNDLDVSEADRRKWSDLGQPITKRELDKIKEVRDTGNKYFVLAEQLAGMNKAYVAGAIGMEQGRGAIPSIALTTSPIDLVEGLSISQLEALLNQAGDLKALVGDEAPDYLEALDPLDLKRAVDELRKDSGSPYNRLDADAVDLQAAVDALGLSEQEKQELLATVVMQKALRVESASLNNIDPSFLKGALEYLVDSGEFSEINADMSVEELETVLTIDQVASLVSEVTGLGSDPQIAVLTMPNGLTIVRRGDPEVQLDDMKLMELDLFHQPSGFGFMYMTNVSDAKIMFTGYGDHHFADYSFDAYMAAYQQQLVDNIMGVVGLGMSNQEVKAGGVVPFKKDSGMVWNASVKYLFPIGKNLSFYGELGYLHQETVKVGPFRGFVTDFDPSAGYWKVGLSFSF